MASWEESYDKPRQCALKQRHHFANKGPSNQGYGLCSSQVWIPELDNKEGSESASCAVVPDSLRSQGLYSSWTSLDQNTGVGHLSLLQGLFQSRDRTQVSHIAGGFFTS